MVEIMTDEKWLTVEEVADILKASRWTVRQWLRTGRLKGVQIGGRKLGWRVPEGELQRILREGLEPRGE